jgi:hypothetical protein
VNRLPSHRLLFALGLTALASAAFGTFPVASAASLEPVNFFGTQKKPLLYLTESRAITMPDGSVQTYQHQAYVFRDGTVVGSDTGVDSNPNSKAPSAGSLWSIKLEKDRLASLSAALRAVKAGTMTDCSQATLSYPLNEHPDTVFTWFGQDGRTNTFTIRRHADLFCTNRQEVYNLLTAAHVGVGRITDAPVNFSVPPPPISHD